MGKRIQEANNHLVHLRRESSEGAALISCLPTWPILEAGISAEKCFHHWPAGTSMEHFLDWTWMWKGPTYGAWWPLWEGASDCIRKLGKPWRSSLPVCKHCSLWSVLHSGPCVECLPLFLFVVDWRLSDETNPSLPGLFFGHGALPQQQRSRLQQLFMKLWSEKQTAWENRTWDEPKSLPAYQPPPSLYTLIFPFARQASQDHRPQQTEEFNAGISANEQYRETEAGIPSGRDLLQPDTS